MTEPTLEIRKEILRRLQDHLRILEDDLLFEQSGGEIFYVVDFSVLYAYMWKKCQGLVLRLPDEPEERVYARRQVTLSFLFGSRVKNLLLIPPYSEELCDHIQSLDHQARIADFDVAQLEKLKTLIKASPEFRRFNDMRSAAPSAEAKDSEQQKKEEENWRKAVIELGKNYFPELFTIISCEKANVLYTLQRVFEQQIIMHSDSTIKIMEDFGNDFSIDCMVRWKKKIARGRKREQKTFSTLIDAFGCAYLEIADKRLQENNVNQMVVFVSASQAVIGPIHAHEFRSVVTGLPRNLVRDLDFFWVRSVQPDLESVRQNLDIVVKLLRICDSPGYDGQIEAIDEWRQTENLFLLTDSHLLEHSDTFSEQVEEDFLSWLYAMHEASTQSGTLLESQRRRLFENFRQKISRIDKILPARTSIIPVVDFEARRAFLKGLPDEADVVVELFSNEAISWAKRVGSAQSEDSKQKLRQEILDWANHRSNPGSLLLLAGYMLASEEKYDAALGELLKGLPKIGGREKKELLYLAAMIERKLFNPIEALAHILAALEVDNEDPRFRVECGKIYWLKWQKEKDETRSPSMENLKTATEHLEFGLKTAAAAPLTCYLLPQAENALAFIRCELALSRWPDVDHQEIVAAEGHLKRLRELEPEAKWLGRYYDTSGWVLYTKAVSSKDASDRQKRNWLTDAENHMRHALQQERTSIARQRLVRSHLIKIRQALAGLPTDKSLLRR